MGVDHNIRLGTYVECKYQPVESVDTQYHCSKDPSHRPSSGAKFCATCGTAISEKLVKTGRFVSPIDTWEISKELKDRLYSAHSMGGHFGEASTEYWIPNISWGGSLEESLSKYEEAAVAVDPTVMASDIALFSKFFEAEIAVLRKHYQSVTVRWGLLAYCS